jgi:hypothetical protein
MIGLTALAVAILASPASAQDAATATTTGSTSISAPASLSVTQNLTFSVIPSAVNTGLTITSSTASGVNANFAVVGAQTTSISVPATFDVIRVGGTESVTVRTIAPVSGVTGGSQVTGVASGSLFSQPVTVTGNIDSGMMSFSVGGAVTVANNLTPGQYQGVLTVVAQYN